LEGFSYTGSIFICVPTALAQGATGSSPYSSNTNHNADIIPLGGMPGASKIEKNNEGKWIFKFQMYIQQWF
jgi:hypothetical protein